MSTPYAAALPLYLIVPAHNEEKNIGPLLESYSRFYRHDVSRFHVVVNNTNDATVDIARNLSVEDPRIIVSNIEQAIGKGGAIIAGLKAVSEQIDYIGFVDADGAIAPAEYDKLLEKLSADPTIGLAIASRWVKGAKFIRKQTLSRQISSRAFNLIVRLIFGFNFHDTQCGAKILTYDSFIKIKDQLQESSFAFDIELLWQAKNLKIKTVEVPIDWQDRPGSSVVVAKNLKPVAEALWRIRFG